MESLQEKVTAKGLLIISNKSEFQLIMLSFPCFNVITPQGLEIVSITFFVNVAYV